MTCRTPDGDVRPLAERLFERIEGVGAELGGVSVDEAIQRLGPEVRALMISFHDDGSWPEPELSMEALQAVVDVVDGVMVDQAVSERELIDANQRWLTACRQSARSLELLEEMLAVLRPEIGRAGYSGR